LRNEEEAFNFCMDEFYVPNFVEDGPVVFVPCPLETSGLLQEMEKFSEILFILDQI
jgi:hypothetical protein